MKSYRFSFLIKGLLLEHVVKTRFGYLVAYLRCTWELGGVDIVGCDITKPGQD